jgi:hypothetical protein
MAWFDGWGLSDKIALIAIIVGFLQFGALVATVIVTVFNGRRELRAYVMIDTIRLENVFDGGRPEAVIIFKNSSQTPAAHLTHWAKLGFTTFPEVGAPIPARDPKTELPEGSLAPGGTIILRTGIDMPLNRATITALNSETHALYLRGEVRYVDAFGTKRETDFLMFSTGKLTGDGIMAGYKEGNRIT